MIDMWIDVRLRSAVSASLSPALAHGLLVYQAAEAIKMMPFINTLLSDAAMLPAADENHSSCA